MSSKIRIGCIGIGGISNGVHIPGILASDDLQLIAVCDNNPDALARAKERYGIDDAHCFADFNDLIACPDVDAVDITTPNDEHFRIAMAAARSGKPFSLEKPITLTSEEADELAAEVEKHGNTNMICFSYRFRAASRYARDIIAAGTIGEVYHVYGQFLQGWGKNGFGGMPAPLMWRFDKKRTGSGALGDLGSHILDLATFVTGKDFVKVFGHTDTYVKERMKLDGSGMAPVEVDDYCHVLAEMDDKVSGVFEVSRFAYGRDHQRLEIYGSKGSLIYTNHGTYGNSLQACVGSPYSDSQQMVTLDIPKKYYVEQMQSFADLINGNGSDMTATMPDGLKNQHVLDSILKSVETGGWEYVK